MKYDFFNPPDPDGYGLCSIAAAIIGAGALTAGASIYGSQTGAAAQRDAAGRAIASTEGMFGQAKNLAMPYIRAGEDMLPTLKSLLTPGANQTATLSEIPGFKFAQDWGQKAVQSLGTMRGLGGNVLKAGADYATGKSMESFFPMVQSLQALVNTGAGAAGSLGGNAMSAGKLMSDAHIGAGNATAGAQMATGNAIGNFGNSLASAAMWQQLTGNRGMYGGEAGFYGGSPATNPNLVPIG